MKQANRCVLILIGILCFCTILGPQSVLAYEASDLSASGEIFFAQPLSYGAPAVSDTSYKTYYYDQLGSDARALYDIIAAPENLERLKAGEEIVASQPFEIAVPKNPTQEEYDALIDRFAQRQSELAALMSNNLTNVIAAFNRDHSELFWLSGVQAWVQTTENGTPVEGNYTFGFGKTYALSLVVVLGS